MLLIYLNFFLISVEVAFDFQFHELYPKMLILEQMCFWIFTIDIALKFNLQYYKDGVSVKNRAKIIKNYIKTSFFLDILSVLALIAIINDWEHGSSLLKLLFFLQYPNIGKIYANIEQLLINEFGDLCEMALVLFKTICITHLFACGWHYLAYYLNISDPTQANWLTSSVQFISPQSSWYNKYLLSIYWALTTLVTVGYGDISPKNLYETVFCTFTLLCGTLVFGYCVNCVGFILQKKEKRHKELK